MAELNNISKNKRMGSAEDSAKSDCSNLQSQLNTINEELTTLTRTIEGLHGTLADIRGKLAQATPLYEQSKLALDQLEATIKNIEQQIAQVEDHVFEDFCAQINVVNIREYEAMQFGVSDEVSERRAQFATQKSRLETQLAFERNQLNELIERLRNLEATSVRDAKSKAQLEADLAGMAGKSETLRSQLESFKVEQEKQAALEEAKQVEINEISRALQAKGRDVEAILREFRAAESECNKVQAERVAIFRKCKLEGINLPLKRGSMNDIIIEETRPAPSSDMDADASSVSDASSVAESTTHSTDYTSSSDMDLDAPSQTSIQSTDWEVEVDFDGVGPAQRADDGPAIDRKFQDEIKRLGEEIEHLAPNLKANERLEGVSERLKVAEQEFNTARSAAKRAKEQFMAVKRKR